MFKLGIAGRRTCVRQANSLEVDVQQDLLNFVNHQKEFIGCT